MAKLLPWLLLTVTVHLSVSQRHFRSRSFHGGKADNPSEEELLERALSTLIDRAEKEENPQTRALRVDKREDLGFPVETAERGEEKREGGLGSVAEEKRGGGELDASQLTIDHVKKALYRRLQDDTAGESKGDNLRAKGAMAAGRGSWRRHKVKGGQKSAGPPLPSLGMGGAAELPKTTANFVKGRSPSVPRGGYHAHPASLRAGDSYQGYAGHGYLTRGGYPGSAGYLTRGGYPGSARYPGSAEYFR